MKTCLLSGNFALDTIVMRDYPNGFVVGKSNKFTETIVTETVGNTCGNVACILANLGVQTFPIANLDLSEQGLKIKTDLQRYGADVRFVENSASGGTTLLRCTHKRDKTTGEHTVSFRAASPGSRFPKHRFIRVRDEAPAFVENLDLRGYVSSILRDWTELQRRKFILLQRNTINAYRLLRRRSISCQIHLVSKWICLRMQNSCA
jgi:hypothetical protein